MSAPRRLCLVTGASSGIGAALARAYAARGWDLALTARREDRLRALSDDVRAAYGTDSIVIRADLTDPAAPERMIAHLESLGRPPDGLVNNAGLAGPPGLSGLSGLSGPAMQGDAPAGADAHADFLQLMIGAPTHLARLCAPGMAARGFGRIVNVASLAGLVPPPRGQGLYGAAKAFLIESSRAMNQDLRGSGVHVTALCPGLTRTEFHAAAGMTRAAATVPGWLWQDVDAVARSGLRASEANAPVHVPGLHNRIAAALFRILPDGAGMALMARLSRHWDERD